MGVLEPVEALPRGELRGVVCWEVPTRRDGWCFGGLSMPFRGGFEVLVWWATGYY